MSASCFIERIAHQKGYRVSQDGEVFTPSGKLRKSYNSRGYRRFTVHKPDGKTGGCSVHRLQAYQIFGEAIYSDGFEVRHLNGIRDDNRGENLAIGSHAENMQDKSPEARLRSALAASKAALAVTIKHDYSLIQRFYDACRSYKQTMAEFGITSKGTLNYILRKRADVLAMLPPFDEEAA